jgi:hypothetical protein
MEGVLGMRFLYGSIFYPGKPVVLLLAETFYFGGKIWCLKGTV